MPYLIYQKDIGKVTSIVETAPIVDNEKFAIKFANDFELTDVEKYDILVLENSIISTLKANSEIKTTEIEKEVLTLTQENQRLNAKITELESEKTQLQFALAESVSVAEQNKVELQLAIAELASIVLGGIEE